MKDLCKHFSGGDSFMKPVTQSAKGTFLSLLLTTCAAFTACTNEVENTVNEDSVPLGLEVNVQGTETRAIVEGTTLPDASLIGVAIKNNQGADYENKGYTNVKYTVTGSSCTSDTEIMLSATEAKVYAYYPYNEEVTDITAIPMTIAADVAEQDDYMYATYSSGIVSKLAPNVSLTMNHALSAVKIGIKKTSDETDYSIQKMTVKSGGMAKSGKMNAKDGSLTDFVGAGNEFSQNVTMDLTKEVQYLDEIYFIPTGQAATVRFVATIGGTDYVVVSNATTFEKGKVYTYTMSFDNETVEQPLTLSSVNVTAYGSGDFGSGTLYPRTPSHGEVYAVNANGELISADFADETCIAAALVVGEHKFWIAKDKIEANWTMSNFNGITDYAFVGGGSTSSYGHLLQSDWTYQSSPYLSADYTTWTTGALSDFNGRVNSSKLESVTTDGCLGKALVDFKADNGKNLGKSDWYIPSIGQLALIYINKNELNTVLTTIGGVPFWVDACWSSSEIDANYAWLVNFNGGIVYSGNAGKNIKYRVLFIRDIE